MMELHEKLESIEDEIKDILISLEIEEIEINSIIIGDRIRVGDSRPPGIWVFIDDSPIDTVSGLSEEWALNVVVAGTYMSDDLSEARKKAQQIAAKASTEIMKDRTLDGNVRDIKRNNFLPGMARIEGNEKIYGAGFQMAVIFRWTPS